MLLYIMNIKQIQEVTATTHGIASFRIIRFHP
jgi:hypothetical protein